MEVIAGWIIILFVVGREPITFEQLFKDESVCEQAAAALVLATHDTVSYKTPPYRCRLLTKLE